VVVGSADSIASKNLRVAEVTPLDLKIENGKLVAYRARVSLSFKHEGEN
jgi:flavin-binding protein dodecin